MPDTTTANVKNTQTTALAETTLEERQAILALERLSLRWPKSLYISTENGVTTVKKTGKTAGILTIPHE